MLYYIILYYIILYVWRIQHQLPNTSVTYLNSSELCPWRFATRPRLSFQTALLLRQLHLFSRKPWGEAEQNAGFMWLYPELIGTMKQHETTLKRKILVTSGMLWPVFGHWKSSDNKAANHPVWRVKIRFSQRTWQSMFAHLPLRNVYPLVN